MKYEVRCECGKAHAVTGADAGTMLRCACGRAVDVPPFHQLRTAGGETAIPILVRIRAMLSGGQLPGTRNCVGCGRPVSGVVRVGVACDEAPRQNEDRAAAAAGCLLGWLPGWSLAEPFTDGGARGARHAIGDLAGPELSVIVPIPVCETCRPALNEPAELRKALRRIPEYAALLDRYPHTQLILMG